ncbi:uncharacterized protein NECHADRAFT_89435 [Fusarium vanettenii 77-13-4]|uniref:Uncharacterized protein n=1 Tax=Fusarium vanettenii (strain ATCC MYA-4622 / CBS 123669 / FGSC 9596 / NRRL 45880 / 77-13-4) TaxID=660122 RepID=C7ZR70_FUSV7|nr:uncharacterized protein NECHADRAFT_89435 [Fusarium vanettenii 77-13-4]EEU33491.1 predicted protein [Fusarium vanettenii 77-13-4]
MTAYGWLATDVVGSWCLIDFLGSRSGLYGARWGCGLTGTVTRRSRRGQAKERRRLERLLPPVRHCMRRARFCRRARRSTSEVRDGCPTKPPLRAPPPAPGTPLPTEPPEDHEENANGGTNGGSATDSVEKPVEKWRTTTNDGVDEQTQGPNRQHALEKANEDEADVPSLVSAVLSRAAIKRFVEAVEHSKRPRAERAQYFSTYLTTTFLVDPKARPGQPESDPTNGRAVPTRTGQAQAQSQPNPQPHANCRRVAGVSGGSPVRGQAQCDYTSSSAPRQGSATVNIRHWTKALCIS